MRVFKSNFDDEVNKRYDKWQKDIKRLLTCNDEEEATDILNDVILTIYERLKGDNCIEMKNVDGYVYTACRFSKASKSSSYQRKREMNHSFCQLDEAIEIPIYEEDDKPTFCFADIQKCLDESDFCWSEKEIFLRKNLEGKTKRQMANEIGCSRGRLSYRYGKVRDYLKDKLKTKFE